MLLSIGYGCGCCFTFVCFDDVLIEYWCCLLVVSIGCVVLVVCMWLLQTVVVSCGLV